ncbi:MAG: transposase [Saprospiraceae bacterium]
MRKSKFTDSQRLAILAKHDAGQSVDDICREHQISPATFYKWKKESADNENEDKRRLKKLELENARLKKMFAELSIDHEILSDGYEMLKKWQAQDAKKKPLKK